MKKLIFIILTLLIVAGVSFLFYRLFFLGGAGKGALQVTSTPEATVYLNDQKIGMTPLCVCGSDTSESTQGISSLGTLFGKDVTDNLLPTGEYVIKIVPSDKSLSEFQEKITIGKNVLTVVDRKFSEGAGSEGSVISLEKLPDAEKTELLVLTVPDNATVILDGERVGASPIHKTDITASNHELLIRKNGYMDKAVRIKTAQGYKLVSKIYLGVNGEALGAPQSTASESAEIDAQEEVQAVRILSTGTGFLRVREGPSVEDSEVGRVTPDEVYPLINDRGEWYEIEYEEGETGWISSEYAEKVEEEN